MIIFMLVNMPMHGFRECMSKVMLLQTSEAAVYQNLNANILTRVMVI